MPPQLAYTPGPTYHLDARWLTTAIYSVETPDGWRVIAGPAEDPYTFQFVAPDNTALIVVTESELSAPPMPAGTSADALTVETASVEIAGRMLYVILVAPVERQDVFVPIHDAVRDSLR